MTLAATRWAAPPPRSTACLSRLAHLADEGELSEYLDLFTPDAVWEMRDTAPTARRPNGGSAETTSPRAWSSGGPVGCRDLVRQRATW